MEIVLTKSPDFEILIAQEMNSAEDADGNAGVRFVMPSTESRVQSVLFVECGCDVLLMFFGEFASRCQAQVVDILCSRLQFSNHWFHLRAVSCLACAKCRGFHLLPRPYYRVAARL